MSYRLKKYNWMVECANIMSSRRDEERRKEISGAISAILAFQQKKRRYAKKRFWVVPIFQRRLQHGFYHATFPTVKSDAIHFVNYFRMSATQFEDLSSIVGQSLKKANVLREPIDVAERLALTLRYLASGDSMTSIAYQYLIGLTTVTKIISETCEAIWDNLHCSVLSSRINEQEWLDIAQDFEDLWNFPHCIGAIDGKHIIIQCPNNAGSMYYNYKNSHSIVLLAICDARYIFRYVDIGAHGRRSDGGIRKECGFGKKFEADEMHLPKPKALQDSDRILPYYLVGDEAFPLKSYLLRPYPGRNGLTPEQHIYNYRLSRARKTIENFFGILSSQWQIFRKPIICSVETAIEIVKATICLHNWLRMNGEETSSSVNMVDTDDSLDTVSGPFRSGIENQSAIQDTTHFGSNSSTREAMKIRDEVCEYFNNEGAVPWQFDR